MRASPTPATTITLTKRQKYAKVRSTRKVNSRVLHMVACVLAATVTLLIVLLIHVLPLILPF